MTTAGRSSDTRSYVYSYTVDSELWYVGKGVGNRSHDHLRAAKRVIAGTLSAIDHAQRSEWVRVHLPEALRRGAVVEVDLVHTGLTDAAAADAEREMIAVLEPRFNKQSAPKAFKQTTRLRKIACPACGYTARTTSKWLAVGTPTCCCGTKMKAL